MTASDNRLTSVQIRHLQVISVNGSLYRKQAIALLAIHDGVTQTTAATTSGLTLNQVRYWLKKFRSQGLQAFPEAVADKQTTATAEPPEAKPKKSKKEKKPKTGKDDKQKTKKTKKDKHKETKKKKEKKNKKSKKKTKDKK